MQLTRRHLVGAGAVTALTLPVAFAAERDDAVKLASDYLNATGQDSISPAAAMLTDAPESAATWYARGMVARAFGDHAASLEAFRRSLDFDPADYKPQAQLGMTLINLGKPAEGVEFLTEALRTSDHSRAGLYAFNLGRANFFTDRYAEAATWFWKAFTVRPELRFIAPYLAASLALDGSPEVARRVLRTDLTVSSVVDDETRNPSGSDMMTQARERLHDSLLALGIPA